MSEEKNSMKWWSFYTDQNTGKLMFNLGKDIISVEEYEKLSQEQKETMIEKNTPLSIRIGRKIGYHLGSISDCAISAFCGSVLYDFLILNELNNFKATFIAVTTALYISRSIAGVCFKLGSKMMLYFLSKE